MVAETGASLVAVQSRACSGSLAVSHCGSRRIGAATFERRRSFNDAWLLQETLSAKVAVDSRRRVWLGITGRFITNFGPGKGRWAGFGPIASFHFGR